MNFCKSSQNIDLNCLSVHIGSQILDHKPYEKMLKVVDNILKKTSHEFEYIDLGGGMGISYADKNKKLNYKKYNLAIKKFLCVIGFSGKIIDQINLKDRIKNSTDTLLIHGDVDQIVPSTHLLEAKDFLIRNNIPVETLLIKNCDHHIPIEASSTALNYILKKI